MSPQLSWIGLGNMGRGMVSNLVTKGPESPPVIIYNRTTSRSEALSSKLPKGKTTIATSITKAVKNVDIIFICLSNDATVTSTVDTILEQDVSGKLIVDCSTVGPETSNALAKKISGAGGEFVAMPVFGAPAMADAGSLICVLAGPKASVQKVLPYTTNVMGRANIDFSDQAPGQATLLKIIGNTFVINMVESLAEGHTLAESSGLGTDNLHQWISVMFPGPYTAYSSRMLAGDYYKREDPLFAVDLARKDAGHALKIAEQKGAKLRGLEVADQHLKEVKEHLGAKGDLPSIYGAVRKESGLKFENVE
ncbi:6-phosphogluconate dehydrogenase-like protein NAD-binding protein [Mytilinidion resinicola]|uniref:6-phosphogluconate dehydrogenase-like protein NAD-binding protein n=1 Tax=Mytilinidion resinicola TaxID=574789 RepID=A0A6A6XXW7_9PEZI|nr:6-phosphogluconate dehydrogenase-like protein NAD-binding protein [Mytilinidion resinicola]KAF2801396.1 6-phosphogluconate dehydrogenase-like protein NAD-binding protein [Mytilinidion resinicola]